MTWPRKISDRKFVEQANRFEKRWRRRAAISMLFMSLVYVGCAVWFYRLVSNGIYPIASEFFDQTHRDWFEIGIGIGYFAGKFCFFALFGIFAGGYYLTSFSGRQHRLLVKLFERLDQLGELDQDGQLKSDRCD